MVVRKLVAVYLIYQNGYIGNDVNGCSTLWIAFTPFTVKPLQMFIFITTPPRVIIVLFTKPIAMHALTIIVEHNATLCTITEGTANVKQDDNNHATDYKILTS